MKKQYLSTALLLTLLWIPGSPAFAANMRPGIKGTGIGIGAHYHSDISELENTDFDDDYLSYMAGIKFRLSPLWVVDTALEYYPPKDDISYILSPRITLLHGQGFYFGAGIEWMYVKLDSGESNWSDKLYTAQAGFEMPLSGANVVSIDAYYELETLSDMPDIVLDFDSDMLTFSIRKAICYRFDPVNPLPKTI